MLGSGSDIVRGIIRQHRGSLFLHYDYYASVMSSETRYRYPCASRSGRDFIRTVVCRNPILHSYCYSNSSCSSSGSLHTTLDLPVQRRETDRRYHPLTSTCSDVDGVCILRALDVNFDASLSSDHTHDHTSLTAAVCNTAPKF